MVIPYLTQPPHERTLTGRGSRVYPKRRGSWVRPGQGRRCAQALPLAARALAARCMNSYYTIRIKKCMNWYKNHTVYEFVLYNLYIICMNSFVWIRTKISEKKICIRVGISTWDQNGLQSLPSLPSTSPPPLLVPILFIYPTIRTPSKKVDCTVSLVWHIV
jgi:hypothetical protein